MLLNMAVADAYAIPFEFVPHTPDRPNDLRTFHRHPRYHELITGQYTDDTQRSIANAEVVLSGDYLNARAYADSYVRVFERDPREGYSSGYQKLIRSVKDGDEFLRTCRRARNSNGAVMGAAVLGYIKDVELCKLAATIQACTTHLPTTAIHAQIIALSAHYFIYDLGTKAGLVPWLFSLTDSNILSEDEWDEWSVTVEDQVSPTTLQSRSISAFVVGVIDRHTTMSGILREAVDRGGDTDSAAASAIAVASHCSEIENDLPVELYNGLEDGPYGREFLHNLDNQLVEFAEQQ